ncbi:4-(cytidine 5'-diphospho)-2-C-methyl-D-erythritol kinase [Vallitalea okinawensis]|uniref:4-(cytidine 5'-diphospho)-2-C-methyl-D-erythritol kinase n=1 Tax=Vallitalea okinawensis TaxID=2078660 RepID=UPI000CFC5BCA|nr:4-(cytidine 5'-diphospho)-2-C-methyl-D-erythritol kinase [Vallitalea okinawensis]
MYEVTLKARAKINISLDVLRRREDGYHDVKMIMQTVELYDKVYMRKTRKQGIFINVNLRWLPTDDKNLCYKAAKLLMDSFQLEDGVYIDLYKKIPVAAGLAGGSSDAAAVLVGINKLFRLGLSKDQLAEFGKQIGADVPYCIMRGTALAEGIGEQLTPLKAFPDCYVVLAKPDIKVSTPWVYKNLQLQNVDKHPETDHLIEEIEKNNLKSIANQLCNVLEEVTIKEYPVINEIKRTLIEQGALGSLMSGSGPTVFGLFDDKNKAKEAVAYIKNNGIAKHVFFSSIYNPRG